MLRKARGKSRFFIFQSTTFIKTVYQLIPALAADSGDVAAEVEL